MCCIHALTLLAALSVEGRRIAIANDFDGATRPVTVGIRPGHLRLDPEGVPARVYLAELLGETMLLNLSFGEHLLKLRTSERLDCREGDEVRIAFDREQIHLFDPETGKRIEASAS